MENVQTKSVQESGGSETTLTLIWVSLGVFICTITSDSRKDQPSCQTIPIQSTHDSLSATVPAPMSGFYSAGPKRISIAWS